MCINGLVRTSLPAEDTGLICVSIEDFVLRACSNFIPLEGSQNSDPGETGTHEDPNCV